MLQQEKNQASENMPPHLRGLPPQAVMMQMASGYWITQLIYAAAKLGIADLLKDGPKSCEEIAAATGTQAKAVYRVLRTLAGAGVFAETEEPGHFTLTPLAASLRSGVPGSMRAMAVMFGEEQYQAWGEILYSLRTGESSFEHMYGVPMFKYFVDNPEPGEIYEEAMTSVSAAEKAEILKSYDFSYIKKLVEVGGGHGSFISSILKANPNMQGVLFDQPYVIEGANFIKEQGLEDRCELVAGNFYESVPSGGDAYSLKHVLHGCSDEQSITVLKNCHNAMVEHGKLLIVERVVGSGPDSFLAKFLDVNMMMLVNGGCERTETEYRNIIEAAGFEVTNVVPSKAGVSVIESIRV